MCEATIQKIIWLDRIKIRISSLVVLCWATFSVSFFSSPFPSFFLSFFLSSFLYVLYFLKIFYELRKATTGIRIAKQYLLVVFINHAWEKVEPKSKFFWFLLNCLQPKIENINNYEQSNVHSSKLHHSLLSFTVHFH